MGKDSSHVVSLAFDPSSDDVAAAVSFVEFDVDGDGDEVGFAAAAAATASAMQPMMAVMVAAAVVVGAVFPPHSSTGLLVVELE